MASPPNTAWPTDAFAVVEGWSVVEATGPDAGTFLQSFCTNDVLKLADRQACEAMFTDVKAHVIAYGWVTRQTSERYDVLLASDRADVLREHLDRYLIREKAELRRLVGETVVIATEACEEAAVVVPMEALGAKASFAFKTTCDAFATDLTDRGASLMTGEAFEALRIRAGMPFDGSDVDDRNLPQELDRIDATISFTKGCYLGQEPVARIDALGRVNWLLRGLTFAGETPPAGVELLAGEKAVGRVTSSIGAEGASIGLGYIRREQSGAGTRLTYEGGEATVQTLPMG